jgi:hypothetical protein
VKGNVVDGVDGRVVIGIGNRGGIDLDATDFCAGFGREVSKLIKVRIESTLTNGKPTSN